MTATPAPIPLDKSNARIQRMFAAIAPVYDLLNHVLSFNIDRSWRKKTVKLVSPQGDAPILDLCTGTGDLALKYDQAAQGAIRVVGADFCGPMLDRAARKTTKRQADRLRWLQADAQRLPFPDGQFQIVCIAFGLRNVHDPDRGLAEMIRVARPGGRVAILEFSRPEGTFFSRLYRFYLQRLLPLLGQAISKSDEKAYGYLTASVLAFPDGEMMLAKLRDGGLTEVWRKPLTFGIATLYVGTKPGPKPGEVRP